MENLKSMRDCLEEGLQVVGRKTFLYRVVYVGQHDFEILTTLQQYFQQNIDQCNNDYCDEKLTGLLLCYKKFLIHLIEGSEDVIYHHFNLLCEENRKPEIHDLRIMIVWPHLIARKTLSWIARTGQPFKSDIEVYSTCQASPFVRLCLKSMCKLAELIYKSYTSTATEDQNMLGQQEDSDGLKNIETVPDELISKLPDADQIEFLTKCPVLVSLQEVYESMYHISRIPYTEVVWPTPSVYIPYDIAKDQDRNTN